MSLICDPFYIKAKIHFFHKHYIHVNVMGRKMVQWSLRTIWKKTVVTFLQNLATEIIKYDRWNKLDESYHSLNRFIKSSSPLASYTRSSVAFFTWKLRYEWCSRSTAISFWVFRSSIIVFSSLTLSTNISGVKLTGWGSCRQKRGGKKIFDLQKVSSMSLFWHD